jgi:hypothetical protein
VRNSSAFQYTGTYVTARYSGKANHEVLYRPSTRCKPAVQHKKGQQKAKEQPKRRKLTTLPPDRTVLSLRNCACYMSVAQYHQSNHHTNRSCVTPSFFMGQYTTQLHLLVTLRGHHHAAFFKKNYQTQECAALYFRYLKLNI